MNVILKGRVGSHAYGLNTEDSDEDFLGIYAAPTEQFWTVNNEPQETISTKDPDCVMHEVKKYVRLVLQCNPTALELMWLESYTDETVFGWELLQIRRAFITRDKVRSAYLGYADAQMKRMGRERDIDLVNKTNAALGLPELTAEQLAARRAKNARHVARLLWQATVFDITGELPVRVGNAKFFMDAGWMAAAGDLSRIEELWQTAKDQLDGPRTRLPQQQDIHAVNMWLLQVRMASFAGKGPQ